MSLRENTPISVSEIQRLLPVDEFCFISRRMIDISLLIAVHFVPVMVNVPSFPFEFPS